MAGWLQVTYGEHRDTQGERRGGRGGRGDEHQDGVQPGGITLLSLIPDQVVRAHGRQLGLWGDAVVSDRVDRAALRVQAMLGHGAVTRPVPSGGRGPAEQATLVPFGDTRDPERPPDRPWPGRIPVPVPATVCQDPLPARVTDGTGAPVTVTGRAQVSAAPARMSAGTGPWLAITAWAGPGPLPNAGGGPRPRGGGPGSSSSPRTGPPGWPRSRTAAGRSRRDMTEAAPVLVIMAIWPLLE